MDKKFILVSLERFCANQRELLESEHQAEAAEAAAILGEESRIEVADRGVAILNLRFDSVSPSLFGASIFMFRHRLSYSKKLADTASIPQNSITSGDIVGVFQDSFKSAPIMKGVVHSIDSKCVRVIPDKGFEEVRLNSNDLYDIAKIGSKVTHERLVKTVHALEKSHHSLVHYMFEDASSIPRSGPLQFLSNISSSLNQPQSKAVQAALSNSLITVVHGPAGTGKTTTLASIIAESVRANPNVKILACAPSNVAVDNLASRVVSLGVTSIVRIGHPVRVESSILEYTLDSLVRKSDFYESCRDIELELTSLLRSSKPQWSEIRQIRKDLKLRQNKSIQDVFGRAKVVFATCNGSFDIVNRFFQPNFCFDLCVVDECAQALEVSSWIPILHSRRIVLGGDHKQLPATVKSAYATEAGLGISLFERVHARFDNTESENINNLLTVQYRMNEIIMGWSNREFYDNKLQADESNRSWTLEPTGPAMLDHVIDMRLIIKSPFVFCDTAGVDGMTEQTNSNSASKYNLGEVLIVKKYLDLVLTATGGKAEVSIISPYLMQTERLRETINKPEVEVSTVDSFQGRENDLIIISLVRSNESGTVGFLSDYRRLNVAVTRARRQVMIVGDSETVSHDPVLKSLFDYANEFGTVISAQSFITEGDIQAVGVESSAEVRSVPRPGKVDLKKGDQPVLPKTIIAPVLSDENEDRAKFSAQIDEIGDCDKFFFPKALTSRDRKLVHDICEKAGFLHGSVGEGTSRQIWVQKNKPQPAHQDDEFSPPIQIETKVHHSKAMNVKQNQPPAREYMQPKVSQQVRTMKVTELVPVKPPGLCPYESCAMSIKLVSLDCKHCQSAFCIAHATPECHGCGDAAKRSARTDAKNELRKMKNPPIIMPQGKGGCSTDQLRKKMNEKLKSMGSDRGKSQPKK